MLTTVENFLDDLKTGFIDGTKECTFECHSIMLGALTKNTAVREILESGIGYYLLRMSISKAVQIVKAIKPLDIVWRLSGGGGLHQCRFSLSDVVSTFARSVMDDVKPLELSRFNGTATKIHM